MSLVHVQKWLAHLSPEMTLAYARLLDSTRRKEWEQAFAKGALRIDVQGLPRVVNAEQLDNEQEIEWEHIRHNLDAVRLPNGYCFKPKKANCPTQDTPCYTCRHFCTTPDFLPQFEREEGGDARTDRTGGESRKRYLGREKYAEAEQGASSDSGTEIRQSASPGRQSYARIHAGGKGQAKCKLIHPSGLISVGLWRMHNASQKRRRSVSTKPLTNSFESNRRSTSTRWRRRRM